MVFYYFLELNLFSLTWSEIPTKEIACSFARRNSNSVHLIPLFLFHISAARPREFSPHTQKEVPGPLPHVFSAGWRRPPLNCVFFISFFLFFSFSPSLSPLFFLSLKKKIKSLFDPYISTLNMIRSLSIWRRLPQIRRKTPLTPLHNSPSSLSPQTKTTPFSPSSRKPSLSYRLPRPKHRSQPNENNSQLSSVKTLLLLFYFF